MKLTVPATLFTVFLALLCMQGIGMLFPSGYTWGFHFLGYLPITWGLVLLIAGVSAIVVISTREKETVLDFISGIYSKSPYLFMVSACGVYIGLAFLFRVRLPLLGDSYVIINIIEHAISGEQPIRMYSEPLSILFFYGLAKFMSVTESIGIQQSFFTGELLLGVGFIITIFFLSRIVFEDIAKRVLLFGFLFLLPSLQLFFGYIEWYPVVLFCLSLCLLTIILYLRGRIPIYVVMVAYAVLVMTHLLSGLLFPAMVFLAYKEIKATGVKNVVIGLGSLLALFFILYWQFDFNVLTLLHRNGPSLFLSVSQEHDAYHAYTLFSFLHAIDLLNLFILLFPMVFLLLGYIFFYQKKSILSSDEGIMLLLYGIPFFTFIFLFRFDLGMAKDWDIPATFMFPVYVLTGYLFLQTGIGNYKRIMSLVIVVSVCMVVPYFQLNASVDENIGRYETILGSPFMSQEANFGAVSHLSKYYYTGKKLDKLDSIWIRFSTMYPNDWRGYRALTNSKIQLGNPTAPEIIRLFDEWIRLDTTKRSMKGEYLSYCIQMSKSYYGAGKLDSAMVYNNRAIRFDSTSATAYNNLGVLFKASGKTENAIGAYHKAIDLETTYVISYINLANLYDDLGRMDEAIVWYKNGLAHDSTNSDIYENMAIAYYKLKDGRNYITSMRNAARYGSRNAQQYLLKNGMSW